MVRQKIMLPRRCSQAEPCNKIAGCPALLRAENPWAPTPGRRFWAFVLARAIWFIAYSSLLAGPENYSVFCFFMRCVEDWLSTKARGSLRPCIALHPVMWVFSAACIDNTRLSYGRSWLCCAQVLRVGCAILGGGCVRVATPEERSARKSRGAVSQGDLYVVEYSFLGSRLFTIFCSKGALLRGASLEASRARTAFCFLIYSPRGRHRRFAVRRGGARQPGGNDQRDR